MQQAMISRWWWLVLLLTLLSAPVASQGESTTVQIVRVIDGDTIRVCCVFGDRQKVRYICENTPERLPQRRISSGQKRQKPGLAG